MQRCTYTERSCFLLTTLLWTIIINYFLLPQLFLFFIFYTLSIFYITKAYAMIDLQRCTYKSRELNPAFIFLLKILKNSPWCMQELFIAAYMQSKPDKLKAAALHILKRKEKKRKRKRKRKTTQIKFTQWRMYINQ